MLFLDRLSRIIRRTPSHPLRFPNTGFEIIHKNEVLEEERFRNFRNGNYYAVHTGNILAARYQVVGKVGFGATSTVWLARDMQSRNHVTLKVYARGETSEEEFEIYKTLMRTSPWHPGHSHVRGALDTFTVRSPEGDHGCLIQRPMWDSFRGLLERNPTRRFTEELLKAGLIQVFQALDFLHAECRLIHTDIKGDNILIAIEDQSILEDFTKAELEHPSARKVVDGMAIFESRRFDSPKVFGRAVLGDFGSAVRGDQARHHNAQPDVYRSPEIMLKANWSYPVDIWNVGVMIWDLFEGKHMFYGKDPDGKGYSTRAHLAELIGMLGPPPLDLVQRGRRSPEFFGEKGDWIAGIEIPETSLEQSETFLEGSNKQSFLNFMRGMLQWRPEDRKTSRDLLKDPWLNS